TAHSVSHQVHPCFGVRNIAVFIVRPRSLGAASTDPDDELRHGFPLLRNDRGSDSRATTSLIHLRYHTPIIRMGLCLPRTWARAFPKKDVKFLGCGWNLPDNPETTDVYAPRTPTPSGTYGSVRFGSMPA